MTDETGKLESGCSQLTRFDVEVVSWAGVKNRAADAFFHMTKTGIDDSPPEDDVLRLTIIRTQHEKEKTKPDAKIWHNTPCNEALDIVNRPCPRFYKLQAELTKKTDYDKQILD